MVGNNKKGGTMMNHRLQRPALPLLLLACTQGCAPGSPAGSASAAETPARADALLFDTSVPGPCSPNGQPQGQCPAGELFRVRLVPVAEGLRSPRPLALTPDSDLLMTELAAASRAPR